jgi:hypothetical protein
MQSQVGTLTAMPPRRLLGLGALLSLLLAGALLLTPVPRSEGVWAVTVGTETAGFMPVGSDSVRLIQAALSERELLAAADRRRLVAGFGLLGLSVGTAATLIILQEK